MKRLWKGVKRFMDETTKKVVEAVDSVISSQHRMLVCGVIVVGVGLGVAAIGGSIITAAKIAF